MVHRTPKLSRDTTCHNKTQIIQPHKTEFPRLAYLRKFLKCGYLPRRGNGAHFGHLSVSHRLSVKVTQVKITNVCLLVTCVLAIAFPRLVCTLTSDNQYHSVRREARFSSHVNNAITKTRHVYRPQYDVLPNKPTSRGDSMTITDFARCTTQSNTSVVGTSLYPNVILLNCCVGPTGAV